MRFELEALLHGKRFAYSLALELPESFRELRVLEESLALDGEVLFSRKEALVTVRRAAGARSEAQFNMDWHRIALTVIQDSGAVTSLRKLRDWLAAMVLVAPIPGLMSGEAAFGTTQVAKNASNWADWMSGLLDRYPSAYASLTEHLGQVMSDLAGFRFERTGKDAKSLLVRFEQNGEAFELPAQTLSDGEKCFFLFSILLAANQHDGPLFSFWDEPDSYLSISEVSHFIMSLRKAFAQEGQIVMRGGPSRLNTNRATISGTLPG